jgi:hypothetical protein
MTREAGAHDVTWNNKYESDSDNEYGTQGGLDISGMYSTTDLKGYLTVGYPEVIWDIVPINKPLTDGWKLSSEVDFNPGAYGEAQRDPILDKFSEDTKILMNMHYNREELIFLVPDSPSPGASEIMGMAGVWQDDTWAQLREIRISCGWSMPNVYIKSRLIYTRYPGWITDTFTQHHMEFKLPWKTDEATLRVSDIHGSKFYF